MASTDDRLFTHSDEIERESLQQPAFDQATTRPRSGVLGFGATASTYFVVAIVLALIFVLAIVVFAL